MLTELTRYLSNIITLIFLIIVLFVIGSIIWNMYQGKSINFDNFDAPQQDEKKVRSDVRYDDIIGMEEEKAQVKYYVKILKNPEMFKEMNMRPIRGVLLEGPPGVGKTYLMRAVANEHHINIQTCSGSEFVEVYVGTGPKRVRELFRKARESKPSIIFIDEFDCIASKRDLMGMGGNSEYSSTVNEFLAQMDGFNDNDGIMVFAATNHAHVLDNAIMRSGRFDQVIKFGYPNAETRYRLFEKYLEKCELPKNLDLRKFAEECGQITPADIEEICNMAKHESYRRQADYSLSIQGEGIRGHYRLQIQKKDLEKELMNVRTKTKIVEERPNPLQELLRAGR